MSEITKEEIIAEIKKTAEENDGNPLSQRVFTQETGIHIYYVTKFWPRYNDALKEVGYPPIYKYISPEKGTLERDIIYLIRKLGKYPTIGEMKVEYTNNPNFHYNAIKKKKKSFIKQLEDYCKQNSGNDDILKIIESLVKEVKKVELSETDASKVVGEVYMCKYKNQRQPIKVGRTNDTVRRGTEFGAETHDDLVLLHTIKTDDPVGVEHYWHRRFKKQNKLSKNEWFKLTPEDIKAFKRWRKIY